MSWIEGSEFATALRELRIRRRLSQLDLAIAAHTTQHHISFLEQGRSTPGRDIVTRLAKSLNLTLREHNALLATAGFAPIHPESAPDAPALAPVREALQHVLDGHQPYPAMVINGFGDVVANNDAFGLLLDGVAPWLLKPPINAFRVALHPEGMAPRIVNLDDWRRHLLHSLRQHSPHPRTDALLDELTSYGLPAPSTQPIEPFGFAIPLHIRSTEGDIHLVATICKFATALDITVAELRLDALLPADHHTAEILNRHSGCSRRPAPTTPPHRPCATRRPPAHLPASG
jgi:transcriptional regulator with XRE-family HTH domain